MSLLSRAQRGDRQLAGELGPKKLFQISPAWPSLPHNSRVNHSAGNWKLPCRLINPMVKCLTSNRMSVKHIQVQDEDKNNGYQTRAHDIISYYFKYKKPSRLTAITILTAAEAKDLWCTNSLSHHSLVFLFCFLKSTEGTLKSSGHNGKSGVTCSPAG